MEAILIADMEKGFMVGRSLMPISYNNYLNDFLKKCKIEGEWYGKFDR